MESALITAVVIIVIVLVVAFIFLRPSRFRTLVEYERMVVFSGTGRLLGVKGPGLIHLWPWETVPPDGVIDLRDQVVGLRDQHCITSDSSVVMIDPVVVYKITEPQKMLTEIQDASAGITSATYTTLRSIVGTMSLTEVITGRETIAHQMSDRMDEQANRWGIEVISTEIQDIRPDRAVEDAMNRRRAAEESAEAERQETVVKAEARQQAAVAESEAIKTQADAEKYAAIARAEGEKTAEILRSEGIASLYQMLKELGSDVDVALKYEQIKALRTIGESPNSKLVIVPENLSQIDGLPDISRLERAVPPDTNGGPTSST